MITWDKTKMAARFVACMAATARCLAVPPLPITLGFHRRFAREELVKRRHGMVPWARFCRKNILGVELLVQGKENLPKPSQGYMYVSNHQSYVDILVLMEALDTVSFLSKSMVLYLPGIGLCAWAGGTVFLKRSKKDSRQTALADTLRMCRESSAMVIFAEGTRSADGGIGDRIRPGAIQAAFQQGLKIVPVGLDGTFDVVPKTMDRVNLGRPVAVSIGQALDPKAHGKEETWVDSVWQAVKDEHHKCTSILAGPNRTRSKAVRTMGAHHDATPLRPDQPAPGHAPQL